MANEAERDAAPVDLVSQSFNDSEKYPENLVRPLPRASLDHYRYLLSQHGSTLCHDSRSSISLWELQDGEQTFRPETKIDTPARLSKHLNQNEKDPRYRHIFINSANSRLPLDCSEQLLKSVLSFHQIDPFILDHLFTFGKQTDMEPLDPTWCHFKNHAAESLPCSGPDFPFRGRSGHDIRHSFVLRTVELAPADASCLWRWRVRQVAAYHSFDLVTGNMLWITAKGNDVIKKEIVADTTKFPAFTSAGTSPNGIMASFEAAFETHLVYFRWCERNWRWFIRDIEKHIRETTPGTRRFPVGRRPHAVNLPLRTDTGLSSSISGDFPPGAQIKRSPNFFGSAFRRRHAEQPPDIELDAPPEQAEDKDDSEDTETHILGLFTHQDLQTLTTIQRRVEEGRAILELNRKVLKRVSKSYQNLPRCYPANMDEHIKTAIDVKVTRFILTIDEIMDDLETSMMALVMLRTKLEQADRPMLESILQLRPSHASRIFEEHSHQSSMTMQEIADQTKDLTNSTHIISVIAFCLLWAQFATGFLQSGIIHWPDKQSGSGWSFDLGAFLAFLCITAPMTVFALGLWQWKRRSWKMHAQTRLRI